MTRQIRRKFFRVSAAAKYLGVCPDTFKKLARKGAFPSYQITPNVLVTYESDLDQYLERCRVGTTANQGNSNEEATA